MDSQKLFVLTQLYIDGQEGAYDALITYVNDEMHRWADCIRSVQDADKSDLAQEATIRFLNAIAKRPPTSAGDFRPEYLRRILSNCKHTLHRSGLKRTAVSLSEEILASLPSRPDEILSASEQQKMKSVIALCFDRLSEDERDVIEEHYLQNKSYEEISAKCNNSVGSLRIKALRARRKMAETLHSLGYEF